MKTRKSKIIPIFLCGTLLFSCSGRQSTSPDVPSPTPQAAPTDVITPEPTAALVFETTPEPTAAEVLPEATPTLASTPTPAPEPSPVPEPNRACMYVNYANAFPIVATNDYRVQFHYDDTVSVSSDNGYLYDISLSQYVAVEGTDLSDPELWYFCGAFQVDNSVYAHFNYLNQETAAPSILIKIDLKEDDADISCCILSHNPEKHFQDCFALTNESIYYTNTDYTSGNETTSILCTDKNGENQSIFYKGISGETICYMTSDGDYLTYVITNSAGTNRLVSVDLTTGSETTISKLSQLDFLIAWNGFVLIANQDGKLTYFDCARGLQKSISYTSSSSSSAGYPLTDGENIYLPLISYSGSTGTILLPFDLEKGSALDEICLDDTYYYSVGMIDNYLFTENVESYLVFDITGQN